MYIIENVTDAYAHCINEQDFKKLYCAYEIKGSAEHRIKGEVKQKIFCIETEETIAGFPDVMELLTYNGETTVKFLEFKISDKSGNIKFQPTQPAFFKSNSELNIRVVAYNRASKRVHVFRTNEIFDKESPYYTTTGRISLSSVEKEIGV